MQSLFLKSLVLMGVIGGGCFAVWRAHESLQVDSSQTDPQQFAPLDSSDLPPEVESAEGLIFGDNVETIDLEIANVPSGSEVNLAPAFPDSEIENELQPTPAKPMEFVPSMAEHEHEHEHDLPERTPNVFPAEFLAGRNAKPLPEVPLTVSEREAPKTLATTPVMPSSYYSASGSQVPKVEISSGPSEIFTVGANEVEGAEQGAVLQAGYETAPGGNSESGGKFFLPNRLETEATAVLPSEIPLPPNNRFGPQAGPNTESTPGLTKLPPSHPGPVLLPPSALPTLGQSNLDRAALDRTPERKAANAEPSSAGLENPFSQFTVPPAGNESVLPSMPAPNPFEKLEPRPIRTAEVKPTEPSDAGFKTTPPPPSIPKVAENPFAKNQNGSVLPRASTGSLADQPVPSELLPPMGSNLLPPGGNGLSTPAARPAPMVKAFPPSLGNTERVPPEMVEPEPFLPSPTEVPATSGTLSNESVLPKVQPSTGSTLPQIRPSIRRPFPSTAPRKTNGTGLPIISPYRPRETQPLSEPPQPKFSAEASELLPTPAPVANRDIPNAFPPQNFAESGRINAVANATEAETNSVLPSGFENEPAPTLAEPAPAMLTTIPEAAPAPVSTIPTRSFPNFPPEPTVAVPAVTIPTIPTPAISETPTPAATINELPGKTTIDPVVASGPQSPELRIEKIAPPQASIGDPLVYSIRIRNVGGSEARKVVVEDRIPRGTKLNGTIPQAVAVDDKLIWELGTLKPNEERLIKLQVVPMEAGEIGSVATVSFESAISATIRVTAPKLSVDIDGPTESLLGENVPYKFTVRNNGDGNAKDVVLRAILPPSLTHPNGDDIEADLGTIPAGEFKVVNLVVVANEVGVSTPKVLIWMNGKNHAENRADLHVIESRLRLTRTGSKRSFVGRSGSFVTQVTNDSGTPLTNVTIEEHLPVSLEPAPLTKGWNPQRRVIQYVIPQILPGETRDFTTQLTSNQAGEFVSKLIAHDQVGNRAEVTAPLSVRGFADLKADVFRNNKEVAVGDQVSLRLKLKNSGTAPATKVRAAFEIPRGLVFSTASGSSKYKVIGNQVIFDEVSDMPVGAEKSFDIVLIAAEEGNTKVKIKFISADDTDSISREEPIRVLPAQE